LGKNIALPVFSFTAFYNCPVCLFWAERLKRSFRDFNFFVVNDNRFSLDGYRVSFGYFFDSIPEILGLAYTGVKIGAVFLRHFYYWLLISRTVTSKMIDMDAIAF